MVRRPPGHGFWFSDGEGSGRAAGAFVGDQYRPGPGAMLVVLTHHLNMFVNRDGSTRLWRAAGDEFLGSTMAHWKNVTSNMGFEWAPANADGSFPQCYFMNVVVAEEHSLVHCFRAKRKGTAGVPDPAALMVKLSWAHNIVTKLLATVNHLLHSSPLSLHYCTRCTHRTRCIHCTHCTHCMQVRDFYHGDDFGQQGRFRDSVDHSGAKNNSRAVEDELVLGAAAALALLHVLADDAATCSASAGGGGGGGGGAGGGWGEGEGRGGPLAPAPAPTLLPLSEAPGAPGREGGREGALLPPAAVDLSEFSPAVWQHRCAEWEHNQDAPM